MHTFVLEQECSVSTFVLNSFPICLRMDQFTLPRAFFPPPSDPFEFCRIISLPFSFLHLSLRLIGQHWGFLDPIILFPLFFWQTTSPGNQVASKFPSFFRDPPYVIHVLLVPIAPPFRSPPYDWRFRRLRTFPFPWRVEKTLALFCTRKLF